ncbi:MAG: type I restriction endonuclease [Cyanobium sp. MAG06]|nr:type I restriction endonuclease [Cyanobium sp. MAG06]
MSSNSYNLIIESNQNTVVSEYKSSSDVVNDNPYYESESSLEKSFIKQLESQAYQYLNINNENELKSNLREQLEKLNNYQFTDNEWEIFFNTEIANQNQSIIEKTNTIQLDHIKILKKENIINGEKFKNIYLIDKENIHNNHLQVINQYETENGQRKNRYDVTILVNGLPLIHIELKRRGVAIKEAFNQINRYHRESF